MHINGFLDLCKNLSSSPTKWIVLKTSSFCYFCHFFQLQFQKFHLYCMLIMIILRELIIMLSEGLEKKIFLIQSKKTHIQFYYWNSIAKSGSIVSLSQKVKETFLNSTVESFLFSSQVTSMSNALFFFFFWALFCSLIFFWTVPTSTFLFFFLKLHKLIWSQWEMWNGNCTCH